jgi:hypothetical protein
VEDENHEKKAIHQKAIAHAPKAEHEKAVQERRSVR